jgi:hypothetical protein
MLREFQTECLESFGMRTSNIVNTKLNKYAHIRIMMDVRNNMVRHNARPHASQIPSPL